MLLARSLKYSLFCLVDVVVVERHPIENRIEPRINYLAVGWKPSHGRGSACSMTRHIEIVAAKSDGAQVEIVLRDSGTG